jgi:hypothetical protein
VPESVGGDLVTGGRYVSDEAWILRSGEAQDEERGMSSVRVEELEDATHLQWESASLGRTRGESEHPADHLVPVLEIEGEESGM